MKKTELERAVSLAKEEARQALQDVYDALNKGQKQKIVKNEKVLKHFQRFGVIFDE